MSKPRIEDAKLSARRAIVAAVLVPAFSFLVSSLITESYKSGNSYGIFSAVITMAMYLVAGFVS